MNPYHHTTSSRGGKASKSLISLISYHLTTFSFARYNEEKRAGKQGDFGGKGGKGGKGKKLHARQLTALRAGR